MNKKDRKIISEALVKKDWSLVESLLSENKRGSKRFKKTVVNKINVDKVYVEDGIAFITDWETNLFLKTNLENGTYTKKGFKKGTRSTKEAPEFDTYDTLDYKTTMNSKELYKALKKVDAFRETNNCNEAIGGVRIEGDTFIATDSYKLSKYESEEDTGLNTTVNNTVIDILLYDLAKKDIEVEISHDKHRVRFEYGNRVIVANKIELSFPDYKSILNNHVAEETVTVDKTYLKAILTSLKDYDVKLKFESGKVEAESEEYVNKTLDTDFEFPFGVGVNRDYMLDCIKTIDTKDVKLTFGKNCQQPIKIGDDVLMMPINL